MSWLEVLSGSVDAFHDNLICEADSALATRPVGTVGEDVSAVALAWTDKGERTDTMMSNLRTAHTIRVLSIRS
jgi:hypothetical protein